MLGGITQWALSKKGLAILLGVLLLFALYVPIIPVGFWIAPPTGSMEPDMYGCDILLYGPGEPEEGAVMMFWHESYSLLMHRVIEEGEEENTWVFQGDNLDSPDGEIHEDDIQAKIYYTLNMGIPHDACVTAFEPTYNLYYQALGSDRRFSHVDE